MSVYKSKGRATYIFDFWFAGVHHKGNTFQTTKADALKVQDRLKEQLRHRRGGIADPDPMPFTRWAEMFYEHCEKQQRRTGRPKRLDCIDEELRVVLRFFGARPQDPQSLVHPAPGEEAPFHDLALHTLTEDPSWLLEFDNWIDRRGVAGSTRNHYYSIMSRMYYVAQLPEYRKVTGITMNPFAGRPRAPKVSRKVALTPERVMAWLSAMSYHARLAVSIAALAPKLRLQNVLELDRAAHIDVAVSQITVWQHKSDRITGEPLIVPISAQLCAILQDAFGRMKPGTTRVVQYRGRPIKSVRFSIAAAAKDAGIPYGRFTAGGVTFHTLRHTASTILARLQVNPWLGRDAIGHKDLETTAGYTHLLTEEQRPVLERLSAALPVEKIVTAPQRRAVRKHRARSWGELKGPPAEGVEKPERIAAIRRGALTRPGRPFTRKAQ